jgi:hypothetical protein
MSVDDARFDSNSLVGNVDSKNAVHPGEADYNAARIWECAARQPCACAASNKGNVVSGADADDVLNLCCRARQNHCTWNSAEGGQAIAFISLELISLHDNFTLTYGCL